MKIVSEPSYKSVKPCEMSDGEIGVIEKWGNMNQYAGWIVHRYGENLAVLGKSSKSGWDNVESKVEGGFNDGTCLIRILPAGTVIEL